LELLKLSLQIKVQSLLVKKWLILPTKQVLSYSLRHHIYYAQANGQVEPANKIVISLIKKHVHHRPKNWHKTLDQILWDCRISPKEPTNSTPF
jgi:hypothetical protein